MKKGFTLVELLGVLAVISIIASIIIPTINEHLMESKEKTLNSQIALIEKAAADWALEHNDELDSYHLNPTLLSINTLKEEGLLKNEKISNPVTKDEMNGCIVITYNSETSSYSYKYNDETCSNLESEYPKIVSAYETIINNENTVVTGDGLYEIDNEYVYRGSNPNNYLKINKDTYRIISIDKDTKTLKIIKIDGESKNWEESTDATDYSFRVASINTYLNSTFYNTLDEKTKGYVNTNTTWYVGPVNGSSMEVSTLKTVEQANTYNANIGLLALYEYARASLSENCKSDYLDDGCSYDNYLNFNSNYWLINNSENKVWYVNDSGKITSNDTPQTSLYKTYPVFNLIISTVITGTGTSDNPYTLSIQ